MLQLPDLTYLRNNLIEKRLALTNSLLAIIILYYLLKLTVVILPADPIKIDSDPVLRIAQTIKPIPQISRLHLFGVYQMRDPSVLPIAQLGLTLQGILYASDATHSQAIIASSNGDAKTYKIGDSVNGIVIKQILENNVIIENAGALERLPLIRPNLALTNSS